MKLFTTVIYERKIVNYVSKKIYIVYTWGQCYKTFYVRNLRMIQIS
jgi:hypothetical protein